MRKRDFNSDYYCKLYKKYLTVKPETKWLIVKDKQDVL